MRAASDDEATLGFKVTIQPAALEGLVADAEFGDRHAEAVLDPSLRRALRVLALQRRVLALGDVLQRFPL